jgi:hypothetical protein
MRMLDGLTQQTLANVQVYLSIGEAERLRDQLTVLLADPEASEHVHIVSADAEADLSVSIVTAAKLSAGGYSSAEQNLLRGHR